MKLKKKIIAHLVASTFIPAVLFASAANAEKINSIVNTDATLTSDTTILVTEKTESLDRFGGIIANNTNVTVTTQNNSTITIDCNLITPPISTASRVYGLATEGHLLTVNSNIVVNAKGPDFSGQVRAIGVNTDGSLILNGDVFIDIDIAGPAYGIDIWGNDVSLTGNQFKASITNNDQLFVFLINRPSGSSVEKTVNINYDSFEVEANSNGSHNFVFSLQNGTGSTLNLNAKSSIINQTNSSSTGYVQGFRITGSEVNIKGDMIFNVEGKGYSESDGADGKDWYFTYVINMPCDYGDTYQSILRFEGNTTKLTASGEGETVVARPSGGSAILSFSGKNIELNATSARKEAVGIRTQYGALVEFTNPESEININVNANGKDSKAYAYGIQNRSYGGNSTHGLGTVSIAGNVNIEAKGFEAAGLHLAEWDEKPADFTGDGKNGIYLDGSTVINSTSTGGQAYGIYINEFSKNGVELNASIRTKDIQITTVGGASGNAYGIYAANKGVVRVDGSASLTSSSESGKSYGIWAENNSTVDLTGQTDITSSTAGVYADETSVVSLKGQTTINSEVAFAGNGTVNLYNQLTLANPESAAASSGTLNFNEGASYEISGNNWFTGAATTLNGGNLTGLSSVFFEKAIGIESGEPIEAGEAGESGKFNLSNVNLIKGSLTVADDFYTLVYSASAEKAINNSNIALIFTGQLVNVLGENQNLTIDSWNTAITPEEEQATSGVLYASAVLDAQAPASQSILSIGSQPSDTTPANTSMIAADVGVKQIVLSDGFTQVEVNDGKVLTLIGSDSSVNIIQGEGFEGISVGSASQEGTLVLGSTAVASGGYIDGAVTVGEKGTIKVNSGEYHFTNGVETAEGAVIEVGNDAAHGKLVIKDLNHKGTLFVDPAWNVGAGESSEAAMTLTNGSLGGAVIAGRNSVVTIGSDSQDALRAALTAVGKTISENDLQAAVYIAAPVSLTSAPTSSGAIVADGSLSSLPTTSYSGVLVAAKSALIVAKDATITDTTGTMNFVAQSGSFIILDKVSLGDTVTVADGFSTAADGIQVDAELLAANRLLAVATQQADNGKFIVNIVENQNANVNTIIPNGLTAVLNGATGLGADRINNLLTASNGLTDAQAAAAINQIALMGTASGAQATAVTSVGMITDSIVAHGSNLAAYNHEAGSTDVWMDMNVLFTKASDYSAGSTDYGFRGDLWGMTIGADHSFGNGLSAGAALSLGKGSVRGQGTGHATKNKTDYYGFNLYGVWNTPYVNLIGTVGYQLGKNEIKQNGFSGKPDVKTFSVGLHVEKPLALNEALTITPHVGVRYMNVDMDRFNAGGFAYSAEKANLVQIPVGVSVNGKFKAPCEADVKPFLDLTVNPTLGDKKVSNKVALQGTSVSDSFDARIANNAMFNARIGIEANKGAHAFGFNYKVGAGNNGRVDQALQAKYRFEF